MNSEMPIGISSGPYVTTKCLNLPGVGSPKSSGGKIARITGSVVTSRRYSADGYGISNSGLLASVEKSPVARKRVRLSVCARVVSRRHVSSAGIPSNAFWPSPTVMAMNQAAQANVTALRQRDEISLHCRCKSVAALTRTPIKSRS